MFRCKLNDRIDGGKDGGKKICHPCFVVWRPMHVNQLKSYCHELSNTIDIIAIGGVSKFNITQTIKWTFKVLIH